jgi:DNA processing protein
MRAVVGQAMNGSIGVIPTSPPETGRGRTMWAFQAHSRVGTDGGSAADCPRPSPPLRHEPTPPDTVQCITTGKSQGREASLQCVDVPYPADNRRLFDEIASTGGAVVSEFPMGTKPEPWRFPARNRLISGTSLGVLVLESPIDSGSLITAREAADQGRDVFAVPGPIDTGRNAGCHKLIQDGAKLVETTQDILDELGVLSLRSPAGPEMGLFPATAPIPNLPPEQRKVLDMLTLQPRHVDGMIAESGLTAPQVSGILTLLEMRGLAKRVPGNAFVRVL